MNAQVSQLSLYDIAGTPGVAADVSHINTRAQAKVSKIKAARCCWDTHNVQIFLVLRRRALTKTASQRRFVVVTL